MVSSVAKSLQTTLAYKRASAVTWEHEFAWLVKDRLGLELTSLPEVPTNRPR